MEESLDEEETWIRNKLGFIIYLEVISFPKHITKVDKQYGNLLFLSQSWLTKAFLGKKLFFCCCIFLLTKQIDRNNSYMIQLFITYLESCVSWLCLHIVTIGLIPIPKIEPKFVHWSETQMNVNTFKGSLWSWYLISWGEKVFVGVIFVLPVYVDISTA